MKLIARSLLIIPFAAMTVFASAQAFNDFVSDSDSANYGYNANTGWTVSAPGSAAGLFEAANMFTSSASGTVADVILPASLASGAGSVQVQLMSDNGGTVGSSVLETWTMPTTGTFGTWNAPNTLVGDGSASITAGTAYWLVLTADPNSNLWAVWNWSGDSNGNFGTTGTDAYNTGSGWNYQTSTLGAFRVDAAAVPEPASMTLLAIGISGLVARKRRK